MHKGPATPVDEQEGDRMLAEAVAEHKTNRNTFEMFSPLHYRNSQDTLKLVFDLYPTSTIFTGHRIQGS